MVEIAHARPEEREEIVRFMEAAFTRAKWSIDGWRRLLSGRWSRHGDSFAVTARDRGRLVGALGLIPAERPTAAGPARVVNMTSWYLEKPYRGQGFGPLMMRFAADAPDVTLTNFTSARGAEPAALKAGLATLDDARLIWRPRPRARRLPVERDPARMTDSLTARDRRVLADHADLPLTRALVETPDGPCLILLSVKRKSDAHVTHEALYLGDRRAFARHARAIADSLLPPEDAVLSVDRRFAPDADAPDAVEPIPIPRYYRPGRARPEEIDYLYSEIVLVDMKLS